MDNLGDLTKAELSEQRRQIAMMLAPQLPFSAEGYREHYTAIFGWDLPSHGWDWIQEFFEFWDKGQRRFLVKAFRGATKTTIFTIGLSSYILANFSDQAIMVVQKGDTTASDTSSSVAGIIRFNPAWAEMYPDLKPDDQKGWGFNGYEIMDTSVSYEEWRQRVLKARPKDPSLVAYGWASGSIVGRHPHWLMVDDIHDEENTASEREVDRVMRTLKGNILQTLNRPPDFEGEWKEPTAIFSYTPWYSYDCYAYLEATGRYHLMQTPLITGADSETPGAFEWRQKYWVVSWQVPNPQKYLDDKVQEYGEQDFARMQLLDLTAAEGIHLKREWLHEFPADQIKPSWPVYFGVDYASTADKIKVGQEHDYFALAIGRAIPGGGIVLTDVFRERLSQGEAENKTKAITALYPTLELIGFEKLGKGYDVMWRLISSGLPIVPCPMQGERLKPKGERFEKVLGPMFQFSRVWISSAITPGLKAFRDEWVAWPKGKNDDTLDSVYWMTYVAQGHLLVPENEKEDMGLERTKKHQNGFAQAMREMRRKKYGKGS